MTSRFTKTFLSTALLAAMAVPAFADNQPHMQAALNALQQAKQELQAAEHDKGGHREQALKEVDAAIHHVQQGMRYDNGHESKRERRKDNDRDDRH